MKLQRILRLCRGRKVLFDNRTYDEYKKAEQLKQLLGHVADIGKQNGGITYTDKLRRKIKVIKTVFDICIQYELISRMFCFR